MYGKKIRNVFNRHRSHRNRINSKFFNNFVYYKPSVGVLRKSCYDCFLRLYDSHRNNCTWNIHSQQENLAIFEETGSVNYVINKKHETK